MQETESFKIVRGDTIFSTNKWVVLNVTGQRPWKEAIGK